MNLSRIPAIRSSELAGHAIRRAVGRLLRTGDIRQDVPSSAVASWAGRFRDRVSIERLQADVEDLSRPRSRLFAAKEMHRAEHRIAGSFERTGWQTEFHAFTFKEVRGFRDGAEDLPKDPYVTYDLLEGRNVLARQPGTVGEQTILVGAHFDTVSRSPGADDNASGLAVLLELARVLVPYKLRHNVVLAAFDMEEIGGFGARALARRLVDETELAAVIVLESVGYTSGPGGQYLPRGIGALYPGQVGQIRQRQLIGDWTLIVYRRASHLVAQTFAEALTSISGLDAVVTIREPLDLPVLGGLVGRFVPWVGDFARSDHVEFWQVGAPAIQVTDTANFRNPNYHQLTDTPDTLDYQYLSTIATAVATVVACLGGAPLHDDESVGRRGDDP